MEFSLRHLLLLISTGFSAYCVCSAEGQEFILAGKKIMYLYEQEIIIQIGTVGYPQSKMDCTSINEALPFENITIL